ncbi:MAG: ABC transporter substrate-binding protein [Geminicoccaceae bacterium]|nr:ABC transporter substrate-binding protein [Geminicoccaceae bacterium]
MRTRLFAHVGLHLLLLSFAAFSGAPLRAGPPEEPRVLADIPEIGRRGGEIRMLVGRARDTRLLHVYGNARLVGYDRDLRLVPDILKSFEVEDGRIFTFSLRRGHRWSDGHPFTTEDFRFWWEDVALDPKLSPMGPPVGMLVEGEPPVVEVLDEHRIRYRWSKPNPFFLPLNAAATPEFVYAPKHYLARFHAKYADPAELERLVKETKSRDWAQLFRRKERMSEFDNPELPTLQPWMLVTAPPAERFVAVRNPHFHRVDAKGQQLPYLDRIVLEVVDSKLVPIKTGAGETDLQARGLSFKDYTFLKESEARSGLKTYLWRESRGAHLALYPNLNANDPVWRKLFRDRRFRLALSLGLDREAINQYLYFGLATAANNTLLPDSPLYSEEVASACLGFDPEAANRLLDELGLVERTREGIRKLPDGRAMEIVIETAGEDPEQVDLLELVRDSWRALGIKIHSRPSERELFRNRIFAGEALMVVWFGKENGIVTAAMAPWEFAPTSQADQPQWPKWGQHFETGGRAGEAPDLPEAARLLELYRAWTRATDDAARTAIWSEMLSLYSAQCWTIGTVANVLQPIAVRKNLVNVPEEGIWGWEPYAQFGFYRPDTFWLRK